ncbi:MAG TPA: DoxX family membrane protein [Acidimicrobiales bacterium]|nr:DoxX family membrane protein [Acidimicrobiales bacterium]
MQQTTQAPSGLATTNDGIQVMPSPSGHRIALAPVGAPRGIWPARLDRGGLELRPFNLLFRSAYASPIWLVVRLWLGWEWLDAGWQKLTGKGVNNWLSHDVGLKGFIAAGNSAWANRAYTDGHPAVPYLWAVHLMNDITPHAQFFSTVDTFAELAVGLGLLLGCFTAFAAAGGVALNLMYVTFGSAGPNGIFILLGVLLIAAWRVSGYLGADYLVLPGISALRQRYAGRSAAMKPRPTPSAMA